MSSPYKFFLQPSTTAETCLIQSSLKVLSFSLPEPTVNIQTSLIRIAHLLWSGYIGSHIVDILLSQGYQVRGTARSASKLDGLKAIWAKKYPRGHFEVAVVEDMGKDGAFDDAVNGLSPLRVFQYPYWHFFTQVCQVSFTPQPTWD